MNPDQDQQTGVPPVVQAPYPPPVVEGVAGQPAAPQQTPGTQFAPTGSGAPAATVAPAEPKKKANANSTQNSLLIAEIRDGIVIMQDGSFRAVLLAQSINFDLMSQQEREGVEVAFQGFLNSLYFPIQIAMRSRRVDLRNYLDKLEKIRAEHDNILLGLLMDDYIAYIQYLAQTANIMDKQFYVVVPYFPTATEALVQRASKFTGLLKRGNKDIVTISEEEFVKAKTELRNRVQAALESMNQMGVQAIPLNTQELIELYYDIYNPDTASAQPLGDYQNLEGDVVTKGPPPPGAEGVV